METLLVVKDLFLDNVEGLRSKTNMNKYEADEGKKA